MKFVFIFHYLMGFSFVSVLERPRRVFSLFTNHAYVRNDLRFPYVTVFVSG